MMPDPNGTLPDPSGEDGSEDAELGENIETMEEIDSENFVAEEKEYVIEISNEMKSVSSETFVSSALDTALNDPVMPPATAVSGENGSVEMEEINRNLDKTMDDISREKQAAKEWNNRKFLALFAGLNVLSSALAMIFAVAAFALEQKDDSEVPMSAARRKMIRELIEKWWGRTDANFWGDFASAADNTKLHLNLEEQILFQNYVIALAPMVPFIWQDSQELVDTIKQCTDAYSAAGSKTSAMYKLAPTLKVVRNGQDVILPRAEAAVVLRYALNQILVDP